ncbi:uncharacterized protein LOC115603218 [Strigops habroptila]|uniref:uncharacterized protein LOC115603218 n=1 Tax=Strigops habroptila TaxID=2489341 RepID=UPI0011CFDA85|nr:uncharacterized protein LOC115603218 [Strigops habroptila]
MPVGKEANARSQPAEGRPSAQRMRQVARRQPEEAPQGSPSQASSHHGITQARVPNPERFQRVANQQAQMGSAGHRGMLPRSSGPMREQTLRLPPVVAMAPRPPPRSERPVVTSCRLPPVAPAASAASGTVSSLAIGSTSSRQQQLLKTAAQLRREPSHGSRVAWPETCRTPAPLSPTASASAMESSGSVSAVLRKNSTGSRGARRQPAPRQDLAHSRAAGMRTRTDPVPVAGSSKAPAAQPTRHSHSHGGTGAPQSRNTGQAAEHLPAMPAARMNSCINTKFLGVHYRPVAQRLPPQPSKTRPSEQPKKSCLARAPEEEEHQARLLPVAPAPASNNLGKKEAAPQGQRHAPALKGTRVMDAALQVTATSKKRKLLLPPLPGILRTSKKQAEQQDTSQSWHVAMAALPHAALKDTESAVSHVRVSVAAMRPAAVEGTESPVAAEPQGEPSTAPLVPAAAESGEDMVSPVAGDHQEEAIRASVSLAAHEGDVTPSLTEIPGADAGTPPPAPGAEDEGEAAARPLAQDSQHQEEPAALPAEEEKDEDAKEESEYVSDKELSQGEAGTLYNICVNPLVPELFQDPRAHIQEGPSILSSMGTDAAAEAAGDLQSVSPAPAGPTDTEPAAPSLAGAAEEEQHQAPLAAAHQEQEEALASASPGFDEEEAEAEAWKKAFALLSAKVSELLQQETAACIRRDIAHRASAVLHQSDEQPLEQQDMAQSHVNVAMAAMRPAAVEDTEPPVATEPQGEPSTAPLVPAAKEKAAPARASRAFSKQEEDKEAQEALALLSPIASEFVPQELASQFVRDVIRAGFAVIQETILQRLEEQDVAEGVDVSTAARRPAEVQSTESPVPTPAEAQRETPSWAERETPSRAQGEGSGHPWSQLPPHAQRQTPPRVSVLNRALQAVLGRKVRKAPKKHQGEASTTFATPRFYEDAQAAYAAAQERAATPWCQEAPRPSWRQRLFKCGSAPASPPPTRVHIPHRSLPRREPYRWLRGGTYDRSSYHYTYSYPRVIVVLPQGVLHDEKEHQEQQPSCFRRVLRALCKACSCSCMNPQVEE